jgi:hypothetical protein
MVNPEKSPVVTVGINGFRKYKVAGKCGLAEN